MNLINLKTQLFSRLCVSSISLRQLLMRSMNTYENEDIHYDKEVLKTERIFEDLNQKQFESLAKDENELNEIELILTEYENIKYTSLEIPSTLTIDDMNCLLSLQTRNKRVKYFNYLFKKEINRLIQNKQKLIDKSIKEIELNNKWKEMNSNRSGIFNKESNLVYGLWHNSLFTRISPQNTKRYATHRLRNASLFGQNLVFDLSNTDQMSQKLCNSIATQILRCYALNRYKFSEPFNFNFCNIDYNSIFWKTIEQKLPFIKRSDSYLNCTQKSYLDIFNDRSKLVYLSSKAEKLLNFNPNCVYILSSIDENLSPSLLKVKARHENIELRRLPIDEHVLWNMGSKDLKLNSVLSLLNDVKDGHKWTEAIMKNLNIKYMKTPEMIAKEDLHRMEKMKKKFSVSDSQKFNVRELFED